MASKKRVRNPHNLPELHRNEEDDKLLVFGYACKFFRDDVRAEEVNTGKTLIPWMGDTQVMIDRYDGRGHLYDLSAFDSDKMKDSSNQSSEEELRIEALCDEERYLELHTDLMEKAAYEEEEMKRLNEALMDDNSYGAVAFTYDEIEPNQQLINEEEKDSADSDSDEDNQPFVCPPHLQTLLPEDLYLPSTMRIHSIIEKTASFIGTHGPQMEIIIKMKQTNNPMFQFMVFGNPLNPYYKFLTSLIKNKMYVPVPKENKRKRTISSASQESDSGDEHGGSYLHPSLLGNRSKSEPDRLIAEKYKLSSEQVKDTRFAKLLSRMNENAGRESPGLTNNNSGDSNSGYNTPPLVSSSYIDTSSSYGQPPPPGTETTLLPIDQYRDLSEIEALLPAVIPPHDMIPPPPDMQPIIDKMVDYVLRNGVEFEESMRRKNDPRFEFLLPGHFHHSYYLFKKQMRERDGLRDQLLKERQDAARNDIEIRKERERQAVLTKRIDVELKRVKRLEDAEQEALIAAGKVSVSFSIKTKDTEAVPLVEKKPVFAYETSDEEGEGGEKHIPEMPFKQEIKQEPVPIQQQLADYTISETSQDASDVSQQILEKRFAEEKLKDKLALAAREKLVQATKEKQLQVERKRKAALFINMLKTSNTKPEKPVEEKPPVVVVPDISKVVENVVSSLIGGSSNENQSASPSQSEPSGFQSSALPRRFSVPENRPTVSHHRVQASRSPDRRNSGSPRKRRSRTPPSSYHVSHRSRSKSKSPARNWPRSRSRDRGRLPASYESQRNKSSATEQKRSRSRSRGRHSKSKHKTKSPSKRHRSRSRSKSRKKKRRSRTPTRNRNGSSSSKSESKSEKSKKSKSSNEETKAADSDSLPNLSDVEEQTNDVDTGVETKLSKEEIMNKMKVFREKVLKEEDSNDRKSDS